MNKLMILLATVSSFCLTGCIDKPVSVSMDSDYEQQETIHEEQERNAGEDAVSSVKSSFQ